jgi:DNA-binding NarL/FixJ family response regulator
LAAVIGEEAPLIVLRRLNAQDDDAFAETLDEVIHSHLLVSGSSPLYVRFTHALARDSLYAGIPLPRRQRWHRQIAELLIADGYSQPAIIAHHFRQALDSRAVDWFIRAGSEVERVAWLTAAAHFGAALEMMVAREVDPGERGWLLIRRAGPLRNTEPQTSLALLEAAEALAIEANDAVLHAFVRLMRGHIRCLSGEVRLGIGDLEACAEALGRLSSEDIERVEKLELQGNLMSRVEADGLLASTLATAGRIREARVRADATIARADSTPIRAWWARAIVMALEGRPREANEAFMICRRALHAASEYSTTATLILYQISLVQIPYAADDLAERQRTVAAGEAAWEQSGGAHGDVSPRLTSVPSMLLEGDWRTARELALSGIGSSDSTSHKHLIAALHLAQLAREQGDASSAWQAIHQLLPAGVQTAPGHADLAISLALIRVAACLCLDAGDLAAAHSWLGAHDRWLEWSGAVLGRADSHLCWAQFYRVSGDLARMRQHTTQALALAGAPRQPLVLLAAHRLQGEMETMVGQYGNARQHLSAALTLAETCAATYERALTLLAFADLDRRTSAPAAAAALDEARAIFEALNAAPAMRRAETLGARLVDGTSVEPFAEFGLTPREVEVLRLLANGTRNQGIADELFLSVRTVERHIANVYAKIGSTSRAEAIAFAHAYNLHDGRPSAR